MKKNTIQAKRWLDKCYGTSSPSYKTLKMWYAEFKRSCTSTDAAEHSCHLNEAVTEENIKKVHRIVLDDGKINVSEIADMVNI